MVNPSPQRCSTTFLKVDWFQIHIMQRKKEETIEEEVMMIIVIFLMYSIIKA